MYRNPQAKIEKTILGSKDVKILIGVLLILLVSEAAWAGDFTNNLDGTVTDYTTGLMWQQQDDNVTRDWEGAISYCEGLSLASYGDWRLPNRNELESIIDESRLNPAIDSTAFPNTDSSYYWSSTTVVGSGSAWFVDFSTGVVSNQSKGNNFFYARCVRGGQ